MIHIAIINESTVLTDDQVAPAVAALQYQISNHFAPHWGLTAAVRLITSPSVALPTYWQLAILDNSDQADALGYHDVTATGQPLGKVFAKSDIDSGSSWTNTLSHEALEILGDPDINLSAWVDNADGSATLYAYELCDPCEADTLGYMHNGILLSDFVLPAYFQTSNTSGPYDFLKRISKPLEILKDGYLSTFDIAAGGQWKQITGRLVTLPQNVEAPKGSRRERRQRRGAWQSSQVGQ